VVEEGMEGYFSCTPDSVVVPLSAGEGAVVDFGNCPYGRIEGLKFLDLDGDGAQDPGEPGLEGVDMTLTGESAMAVTISGEDGTFVFNQLKPGQYMVEETVPEGHYATRPVRVNVVVGPGESISVIFANCPYATINVNKWLDDGDNTIDASKDKPGAGITMKLSGETLGGDMVYAEEQTGEDGSCTFMLLEAGSYSVTEVFDESKMTALSETTMEIPDLAPGDEETVEFLNAVTDVGEIVEEPDEGALPRTGMTQLPLLIIAGLLTLLGVVILAAGMRRRHQEQ
jgi:LPXTG-motif cell wall-anchored protein